MRTSVLDEDEGQGHVAKRAETPPERIRRVMTAICGVAFGADRLEGEGLPPEWRDRLTEQVVENSIEAHHLSQKTASS